MFINYYINVCTNDIQVDFKTLLIEQNNASNYSGSCYFSKQQNITIIV